MAFHYREHLSDIFEPAISETVEMLCNLYAEAERADNAPKVSNVSFVPSSFLLPSLTME
jgi:hypothetical protein